MLTCACCVRTACSRIIQRESGAKDFGLSSPADYGYPQFKNDVQTALNDHFGKEHVTRGNKAFDIKENTYRIAADVVPCFEHRRYDKDGTWIKPEGTAFLPDTGARIINWPDQHYANGVAKNTATGQRYKDVVRIFGSAARVNEFETSGHGI